MTEWSLHDNVYAPLREGENGVNINTFKSRFDDYYRLAINRFEWEGLETTDITSRRLEQLFFSEEYIGIVMTDKKTKPLISMCASPRGCDYKNFPVSFDFNLTGANNFIVKPGDGYAIGVGDNTLFKTLTWLNKITDVQTSIDQQVFNTRAPIIAIVDDVKQENTTNTIIRRIAHGVNALVLKKGVLSDNVKPLTLSTDFKGKDLVGMIREYERIIMTFNGLDTIQPLQKAERLISAEQESNDEVLACHLHDGEIRRKELRDNANDLFKLSIDVKPISQRRIEEMNKETTNNEGVNNAS